MDWLNLKEPFNFFGGVYETALDHKSRLRLPESFADAIEHEGVAAFGVLNVPDSLYIIHGNGFSYQLAGAPNSAGHAGNMKRYLGSKCVPLKLRDKALLSWPDKTLAPRTPVVIEGRGYAIRLTARPEGPLQNL